MRVALCFYGLVGSLVGKNGEGEQLDPSIAHELYKKHIIDHNINVDVFIHSWSVNSKYKLLKLYKPKKECIEDQIIFENYKNHPKKYQNFTSKIKYIILKYIKKNLYIDWVTKRENETFRAYSRWYSSKKVLDLKKKYEEENKFKYDVVMITRLDVGFFKDIDFSKYDMNYFYASNRNDPPLKENNYKANYLNHYAGYAFQDLWFFSNSENLDKFSKLYDEIENYEINPHRSSMQHVKKFIGKNKIKYTLYRWFDYELLRRKFFKSKK